MKNSNINNAINNVFNNVNSLRGFVRNICNNDNEVDTTDLKVLLNLDNSTNRDARNNAVAILQNSFRYYRVINLGTDIQKSVALTEIEPLIKVASVKVNDIQYYTFKRVKDTKGNVKPLAFKKVVEGAIEVIETRNTIAVAWEKLRKAHGTLESDTRYYTMGIILKELRGLKVDAVTCCIDYDNNVYFHTDNTFATESEVASINAFIEEREAIRELRKAAADNAESNYHASK